MDALSGLFVLLGLLAVIGFSTLAARADRSFWRKCAQKASCLVTQKQILAGKSRDR